MPYKITGLLSRTKCNVSQNLYLDVYSMACRFIFPLVSDLFQSHISARLIHQSIKHITKALQDSGPAMRAGCGSPD